MKKCTKCGVEYPATSEYFHSRKECKSGLNAQCRTCYKATKRAYNISEHRKAHLKAYRDEYRKNEENKERIRQQSKAWIEKNSDRHKEYRDGWRKDNHEKISRQAAEWKEKNPYKVKWMYLKFRRAMNTPKYEDVVDFFAVRKNKNGNYNCEYCGCEMKISEVSCDHKIPISKGGDNRIENLAISCLPCNLKKGTKILTQFEYLLDVLNPKEKKLA